MRNIPLRRTAPLFALLVLTGQLRAQQTINTTAGWSGSQIGMFGYPGVGYAGMGQTFSAPTNSPVLNSFSFWLNAGGGRNPAIVFDAYIMAWDGSSASGPILWNSGATAGPTSTMQRYDFSVGGQALTPGADYIAFLSTVGYLGQMPSDAAVLMGYNLQNPNSYSAGRWRSLVSASNQAEFTTAPWTADAGCAECDAAFIAEFSAEAPVTPAPEPASLVLMASGLAAIAIWGRRRLS